MTVRLREGDGDDSSRVMAKRVSSLESDHVKEGARGVQKADQSKRIQNNAAQHAPSSARRRWIGYADVVQTRMWLVLGGRTDVSAVALLFRFIVLHATYLVTILFPSSRSTLSLPCCLW